MADHVRQQIRNSIAAALVGMPTVSNIYTGRVTPVETRFLPAVLIITDEEVITSGSKGGGSRTLDRDLTLSIEGHAEAEAALVDLLDTIAKEIEIAITAAGDLGGLAKSIDLNGVDGETSGEGVAQAGFIRLTYNVRYETSNAAPDVAL